jgi:predicted ATPase/class 3 adenylate cyclase
VGSEGSHDDGGGGSARAVTFCLTDIVGSSALWDTEPDRMAGALIDHDEIVRTAVEAHHGRLMKSKGEGDSTFSVFASPSEAVATATEIVAILGTRSWPPGGLRIRAGVHTGRVDERDGDWFGPVVNRAARIRGLAEDAGVLCSGATEELVRDRLPAEFHLVDQGERALVGLRLPERIWAVVGPGVSASTLMTGPTGPMVVAPASSLVGRDADVDAVMALVRRHRLVTLVGAAGAGKTRLAREIAARAPMRAGARLVELADLRDPDAVKGAVFRPIVVEETGLEGGVRGLADLAVLLVVDNCEHLLEAAAHAVREVLDATANVRVLATTRQRLGLTSEALYPVEPLAVPGRGASTLSEVVASPAVQLFLERARAARPGLTVTDADARSIVDIAWVLDGVPLAIELAAAAVTSSGLAELSRGLHADIAPLTDPRRDVGGRHRSIESALDWSHRGVSEEERRVFRRLSSFARFRAEDVVKVAGEAGREDQTAAALSSLVAQSLVCVEDDGGAAAFRLLQPVRLYARQRLSEAGELEEIDERHAGHTLQTVLEVTGHYFVDQPAVVATLRFAAGDIDLALRRFFDTGQDGPAVRLTGAMALYWFFNDQLTGRRWVDRARAILPALDERQRLAVHFTSGLLHHSGTEVARAVEDLQLAVEGYRRLGRTASEAAARFWLGRALFLAGRPQSAYGPVFDRAHRLAEEIGDTVLEAWCQLWLVDLDQDVPLSDESVDRLMHVLRRAEQAGVTHPVGQACSMLGRDAQGRGELALARQYCDQAVAVYRALDDRWQLCQQLWDRAGIAMAAGDLVSAALDVAESTAISLEIGEERAILRGACGLYRYARITGHDDLADRLAAASHALADRVGQEAWSSTYPLPPRPALPSILAARPIDEVCREALVELFE